MEKNKKILNYIGKCLSVLSICFVVYAVWRMGFDFSFVKNKPAFVGVVLVGTVIKIASLYLSSTAWATWLKFFSRKPFNMVEARCVFIKANIGKYIPGNVMHFVQRNLFASGMGISQKQLAVSTIFELLSYVIVALLLAVLTSGSGLLAVIKTYFGDKLLLVTALIIAGLAIIVIAYFILKRKIKELISDYERNDFFKTLLKVMLIQMITLSMLGVVMLILVLYATGIRSLEVSGIVISTYIVAWVLGFVVPGASGGMGIREMALLLLLGPVLGNELVLSLALVHRLITIIGDFAAYLIVLLRMRYRKA